MKKRNIKIISAFVVASCAVAASVQPVLATSSDSALDVGSAADTTELSTEQMTEPSVEPSTEPSTEASVEPSTEDSTIEQPVDPEPSTTEPQVNPPSHEEPSSDVAPELSPSTLTIDAYNTETGSYLEDASFEIEDSSGNVVTFSKVSAGEYEVNEDGGHEYVDTYNGTVKIKGLDGVYTIKNTTNNNELRCDTSNQTIAINPEERKSVTFDYSANYGTLKVTFVGEDETAIPNAKFTIKNSNGATIYFADNNGVYEYSSNSTMSEITTNSTGSAILHLPGGSYTISQTSAPVEYNGGLVSKSVSLGNNEEVGISLVNTKKYGNLNISVSDASDSSIHLTGAEFTITASNGDNIYVSKSSNGSYVFSRTSGDNVITSVNGSISIANLPEGAYTIKQKTGAPGYEMAVEKQFDIKANNTTSIAFKNEKSVGTIKISIIDEETEKPVEGFVYRILNKDSETPLKFKMTSIGYVYDENGSEEMESDENGEIIIEKVPVGNYYISQSKAATGYLLDVDDIEQSVYAGKETTYSTKAVKSNSSIVVVDSDGAAIPNVGFFITNADGEKIIEDFTDEEGKYIISGLNEGEYVLNISSVPEMYAKYTKTMKFTLDSTGKAEGLGRITIEFTKVSVNLGKAGIEVILTSAKDNSTVTVKSDENGIATFTKLAYGDYTITLSDDTISCSPIEFTVDSEFTSVSYNVDLIATEEESDTILSSEEGEEEEAIVNKKVNTNVILVIIAALIALCSGIGGYFFYKKKKSSDGEEETADDSVKVGYDENGNAVIYEEIEVDDSEEAINSEDCGNDEDYEEYLYDEDNVIEEAQASDNEDTENLAVEETELEENQLANDKPDTETESNIDEENASNYGLGDTEPDIINIDENEDDSNQER